MWATLRKLAHHPAMNVTVGVIMVASAVGEMARETVGMSFGAEHGLFAIGILHTLKALPELVEGATKIATSNEEEGVPAEAARDTETDS
jgi:hypothetical protein